MSTFVHWPERRHPWLWPTLLIAALILFMWGLAAGGLRNWWTHFWLILYVSMFAEFLRGLPYVTAGGVLGVPTLSGQLRYVPLAVVQATATQSHWRLDWVERGRKKRVRFRRSPALDQMLERALAAVREQAEAGLPLPQTERQAQQEIAMGTPLFGGNEVWTTLIVLTAGGVLALTGLAFWLNQPILMLPMALLPYLYSRYTYNGRALLTADGLFISAPDGEPVCIPLSDVLQVTGTAQTIAVVKTRHPDFPVFWLNEIRSADLLRRLRSRMQGEGRRESQPTDGLRCSLCGSLMEPGAQAQPGTVLICERCGNRARYEAQQGGHGPAGNTPRPL